MCMYDDKISRGANLIVNLLKVTVADKVIMAGTAIRRLILR